MIQKFVFTTLLLICAPLSMLAQTLNAETSSHISDGILNFNVGSSADQNNIRIGGYASASGYFQEFKNASNDNGFNVDHAFVNVEGTFKQGAYGFFIQADFALSYPLLDAYMTLQPVKNLVFSIGQKQTFTNTRDMMLQDQYTAFAHHSLMSQQFCETGRELGVFAEYRQPIGNAGVDFGVAVTSGDGRNSFGSSSTDTDCGGLKYGGRMSVYPMGFFTKGNDKVFHDFAREENVKLALGAAASYTDGASNNKGEGHADFTFYNAKGKTQYPDLRKFSADVMLKWKGFTLLADYHNTTATTLKGLCTLQNDADSRLSPGEIANYLSLGNGLDIQMGYLSKGMWAFDAAWNYTRPEFNETAKAQLRRMSAFEVGVAKYFCKNTFKVQLTGDYTYYHQVFGQPYKNRSVRCNLQVLF